MTDFLLIVGSALFAIFISGIINYGKSRWVGLTDEDCEEVERWVEFKEEGSGRIPMGKLVRYIEAKLKERNT